MKHKVRIAESKGLGQLENGSRDTSDAPSRVPLVQLPCQCTGRSGCRRPAARLYLALGQEPVERQGAYRELFRYELNRGLVYEIRKATIGNFALGNARFADQAAAALGKGSRFIYRRTTGQAPEGIGTLEEIRGQSKYPFESIPFDP